MKEKERFTTKQNTEVWDFNDIAYNENSKDTAKINEGMENDESAEILGEVTPFIEKIEPKMLKKVFDGWKDRKYHYRELMRKEEVMAEFSDTECDAWADLFYLGTIFRDYLDTVLDLKRPGKSGFQLLDSKEKEVADMGRAMGWFNNSEHMVNIVGDRFNSKYDFLGAIAHEMWHAHQMQVAEEKDNDRSKTYLRALRNYIGIENPEQNKDQLLEREAYTFQDLFKQRLLEAMKLSPEMKEYLLEEATDRQDIILSIADYMRLGEELNWHNDLSGNYFDFSDE